MGKTRHEQGNRSIYDTQNRIDSDGTVEKGLGPADTLFQAGSPYGFQPLTMKILGKEEDKAK